VAYPVDQVLTGVTFIQNHPELLMLKSDNNSHLYSN
jgi:hypothetical protein